MNINIPKSDHVDITLICEGTYPYIRGGVSSWIHQLISGLPSFNFGIIFIGSQEEDYGDIQYAFPANLKHLEVHYLFEQENHLPQKRKGNKKAYKALEKFYQKINSDEINIPNEMKNINFFFNDITNKDFLYSKDSWEFMRNKYEQHAENVPFIDYFWTIRNIHAPIWKIAAIVKNMPITKIIHAPSTGYAGFLSVLASNNQNIPFILTEHGIYTRERKIDMLAAKWVTYHSPSLLRNEPEEMNYIKQMWVRFFEKIGQLSYHQAKHIISLYPGAKKLQIDYGADKDKTLVIPNGVDMNRLNALVKKRSDTIPKVITLMGRVVSIKDIKTFIRSIAIVKKSIPDIEGWIVGDMDEEPTYVAECLEMVKSFDLENNISFLGFQNIDTILPKSGLLTLTSISEGMPLVILEGFAAGLPCVSTDVGSCSDLIYGALDEEDIAMGSAGETTPIANPMMLAEHYIRFLDDETLWKEAQKSALKRVEKYYQEHLFLDSYKNLYERIL